jgi:hypothetical protein
MLFHLRGWNGENRVAGGTIHSMQAFVGIDVAFAKGKLLPICVCTWEGTPLVPLGTQGMA